MSKEQSKKRVLINVQYLGTVCKKVTDDKTKKVTFEDDYTVQSSADFIITESQSVSINRLRRVGRAVHIPQSAKITIQSDKSVYIFDCDFTAKTINVKRGQKSKRINRTKTKVQSRGGMLDSGVDLHSLLVYCLSDLELNVRVSSSAPRKTKAEIKAENDKLQAELKALQAKLEKAQSQSA